ncbi:MAG: hypothetical protein IJ243_07165 [Prevotella sp.]|nr:hypothetical protein [Prevotella sp.]
MGRIPQTEAGERLEGLNDGCELVSDTIHTITGTAGTFVPVASLADGVVHTVEIALLTGKAIGEGIMLKWHEDDRSLEWQNDVSSDLYKTLKKIDEHGWGAIESVVFMIPGSKIVKFGYILLKIGKKIKILIKLQKMITALAKNAKRLEMTGKRIASVSDYSTDLTKALAQRKKMVDEITEEFKILKHLPKEAIQEIRKSLTKNSFKTYSESITAAGEKIQNLRMSERQLEKLEREKELLGLFEDIGDLIMTFCAHVFSVITLYIPKGKEIVDWIKEKTDEEEPDVLKKVDMAEIEKALAELEDDEIIVGPDTVFDYNPEDYENASLTDEELIASISESEEAIKQSDQTIAENKKKKEKYEKDLSKADRQEAEANKRMQAAKAKEDAAQEKADKHKMAKEAYQELSKTCKEEEVNAAINGRQAEAKEWRKMRESFDEQAKHEERRQNSYEKKVAAAHEEWEKALGAKESAWFLQDAAGSYNDFADNRISEAEQTSAQHQAWINAANADLNSR